MITTFNKWTKAKKDFFSSRYITYKIHPSLSCSLNYFVLTYQWELFPWPLIIQYLESRKMAVSICSSQSDQYLVKFMHNNEYVSPRTCFVKFWYIILSRSKTLTEVICIFILFYKGCGNADYLLFTFSPYYCFVKGSILPQWNRHVFQKILPLGPNMG